MLNKVKDQWLAFAARHASAAKWVREDGLYVIVCNLVTVFSTSSFSSSPPPLLACQSSTLAGRVYR